MQYTMYRQIDRFKIPFGNIPKDILYLAIYTLYIAYLIWNISRYIDVGDINKIKMRVSPESIFF